MKRGPESSETRELAVFLEKASKKSKCGLWKRVAEEITAPRRKRVAVNIGKLGRLTRAGEMVVVPGKVLGNGALTHAINIAALSFAKSAREKIKSAGGKTISLREAAGAYPKGSGVKLLS